MYLVKAQLAHSRPLGGLGLSFQKEGLPPGLQSLWLSPLPWVKKWECFLQTKESTWRTTHGCRSSSFHTPSHHYMHTGVSPQVADNCHNDSIRRCRPQNTAEETDGQTETPGESMRARRRKPTFCIVPISHRGNQLPSPAMGGARPLFTGPPSLPTARSRPCRSIKSCPS